MNDKTVLKEQLWEVGWDGHLEAQQHRIAALPMSEKLQWLEEAQRIVDHIAAQRRSAGLPVCRPGEDS